MARVNEEVHDLGAANSVIISNNEDIDVVLRSMGFDQTFELHPAVSVPVSLPDEPVGAEPVSAAELQHTMLDAHRALCRLSEAGRLEFEPVVACLERESSAH